MAAGSLRWTRTAMQVQPLPAFESLRNHAPHLLLSELQRALLVSLTQASGRHLQGLAQGAKCMRHKLGNRVTSKLRLVDDACHLLTHLTPESCTDFLNELQQCLTADADKLDECKDADLGGSSYCSGDGDPLLLLQPMPPPIGHAGTYDMLGPSRNHGPTELEPDSLEVWWADARITDPSGEINELEASPFVATDTSVASPIPITPIDHHAIGVQISETVAPGSAAPGNVIAKTTFGAFEEADLLEEQGATDASQISQEHGSAPSLKVPRQDTWADAVDDDCDEQLEEVQLKDGCALQKLNEKPAARQRKSAAQRRVEKRNRSQVCRVGGDSQHDPKMLDYAERMRSKPDQELLKELKTWDDAISSFGDSDPTLTLRAAACAVIVRRELDGRR